jgi:hypothetical protein
MINDFGENAPFFYKRVNGGGFYLSLYKKQFKFRT